VCTAQPQSAAALVVGNEILSGKVHEQNVLVLARALRALGVSLRRVVVVPDVLDAIVSEVLALSSGHDHVFTSGGVGPTHDDVTVEAVARAFGTVVETEPTMERMIREHFGLRLKPGHLRMARAPRGCDLVTGEDLAWPTIRMKNVWVLPGVPEVFRMKLDVVKRHLAGSRPFLSHAVYTRMDEADLIPMLEDVVARFPRVDVGSYPKWNEPAYRTKLTFDGLDAADVDGARDAFLALLPAGEPQRIG
jgi:molybdenum cofactor synthesis domain-containing protein